jgi:hypothetical protein
VLPPSVVSDAPPSLPQRNLLRGLELGLPNGQTVARAMGLKPLDDAHIMIGKAVDDPEQGDERGPIDEIDGLAAFKGNCPLWTYILAEASQYREDVPIPVTEDRSVKTPMLGPVGGRIVAEVFLGLVFGDNNSLLNLDPEWTPTVAPNFQLRDLVNFALGA